MKKNKSHEFYLEFLLIVQNICTIYCVAYITYYWAELEPNLKVHEWFMNHIVYYRYNHYMVSWYLFVAFFASGLFAGASAHLRATAVEPASPSSPSQPSPNPGSTQTVTSGPSGSSDNSGFRSDQGVDAAADGS